MGSFHTLARGATPPTTDPIDSTSGRSSPSPRTFAAYSVHRRIEEIELLLEPAGVKPDQLPLQLLRTAVGELRYALPLEEGVVEGDRHVQERDTLRHRELELI